MILMWKERGIFAHLGCRNVSFFQAATRGPVKFLKGAVSRDFWPQVFYMNYWQQASKNSIGSHSDLFSKIEDMRCKKRLSIFPSSAGMPLTKVSLAGNNHGITKSFPARESLVSDIPAGDGKISELFYSISIASFGRCLHGYTFHVRLVLNFFFLYIFFCGLECVGHSFAYVAHLWFLKDVWIRTQSTAVASWRATDLATHPST